MGQTLADVFDSPAFVARCMRDGAAELRKRADKLERSAQGIEHRSGAERADLAHGKAAAMREAARQIDLAAEAHALDAGAEVEVHFPGQWPARRSGTVKRLGNIAGPLAVVVDESQ